MRSLQFIQHQYTESPGYKLERFKKLNTEVNGQKVPGRVLESISYGLKRIHMSHSSQQAQTLVFFSHGASLECETA